MSRLEQLYQEMILEHNRHPRCFGDVSGVTHDAFGKNPLCGDAYHVMVRVMNGVVEQVGFSGSGCAISKASGSLMGEMVTGKSVDEVLGLKDAFLRLMVSDAEPEVVLGKLKVFGGVKAFPVRVKCATLVWRALESALVDGSVVSTES